MITGKQRTIITDEDQFLLDEMDYIAQKPIRALDPPAPEPNPLGDEEGDSIPPDRPRCTCGAPACWEVPFMTEPHYEYFCAAHLPAFLAATPIIEPCDFCGKPAHFGACAELLAFTERMKARIFTHPCPSCGDLTSADVCAACREWETKQLDLDFAPVGWA